MPGEFASDPAADGRQPAPPGDESLRYREHRRVPWWWWLVGALFVVPSVEIVVVFGPEFSHRPTVGAAVGGLAASFLLLVVIFGTASRSTIDVTAAGLRVGRSTLPAAHIGRVRVLDRNAMRLITGPQARADAVLRLLPWLHEAVQIETPGRPEPYWVVATKRPAALAAALTQVQAAAHSRQII
ncbi:MAG: DUF3093 domain-containing protein [Acidothermus cellulolyticus]|nr:DUF3093 domain-containing protein [Acidothermus cellulolyticus]